MPWGNQRGQFDSSKDLIKKNLECFQSVYSKIKYGKSTLNQKIKKKNDLDPVPASKLKLEDLNLSLKIKLKVKLKF